LVPDAFFRARLGRGLEMSPESQNVFGDGAEHRLTSRKALVSRLVICANVLSLLGSLAGCARRPATDPVSSGEMIFGKMRAAIEGVSSGIVRVEDHTSYNNQPVPANTFRLVFDDSQKVLRCVHDKRSRSTKYARTPLQGLFQLVEDRYNGAIEIGPPDRDLPPPMTSRLSRTSYGLPALEGIVSGSAIQTSWARGFETRGLPLYRRIRQADLSSAGRTKRSSVR
jgi:hypothetical protein